MTGFGSQLRVIPVHGATADTVLTHARQTHSHGPQPPGGAVVSTLLTGRLRHGAGDPLPQPLAGPPHQVAGSQGPCSWRLCATAVVRLSPSRAVLQEQGRAVVGSSGAVLRRFSSGPLLQGWGGCMSLLRPSWVPHPLAPALASPEHLCGRHSHGQRRW